ncbi:hypothetical protein [Sphingomonas oryzagri]
MADIGAFPIGSFDLDCMSAVDQLTPFFSKGVNGGFSQNLPLTLREYDARLRDPFQPSPY